MVFLEFVEKGLKLYNQTVMCNYIASDLSLQIQKKENMLIPKRKSR